MTSRRNQIAAIGAAAAAAAAAAEAYDAISSFDEDSSSSEEELWTPPPVAPALVARYQRPTRRHAPYNMARPPAAPARATAPTHNRADSPDLARRLVYIHPAPLHVRPTAAATTEDPIRRFIRQRPHSPAAQQTRNVAANDPVRRFIWMPPPPHPRAQPAQAPPQHLRLPHIMTVAPPEVEPVVVEPLSPLVLRRTTATMVDFCSESEDEGRSRRLVQSADQQICFASQTESFEVSDVGELLVCTVCAGMLVAPTTVSGFAFFCCVRVCCFYFLIFFFFAFLI